MSNCSFKARFMLFFFFFAHLGAVDILQSNINIYLKSCLCPPVECRSDIHSLFFSLGLNYLLKISTMWLQLETVKLQDRKHNITHNHLIHEDAEKSVF